YFLAWYRDLRREGQGALCLWFAGVRSGSGRDPLGYVRTPILSPTNSQTLCRRGPDGLTPPYRSGPDRDAEPGCTLGAHVDKTEAHQAPDLETRSRCGIHGSAANSARQRIRRQLREPWVPRPAVSVRPGGAPRRTTATCR